MDHLADSASRAELDPKIVRWIPTETQREGMWGFSTCLKKISLSFEGDCLSSHILALMSSLNKNASMK